MRLQLLHRARGALAVATSPGPDPADRRWAGEWLSPAEAELFDAMRGADRAHSIAVARAVEPAGADSWVISAALLHDVGKATADLGVVGRTAATLLGWLGGRRAGRWLAARPGSGCPAAAARSLGRYVLYPELGADELARAGSEPLVVAWAREHHRPPWRWTVPPAAGRLLAAADDARP